MKDHLVINQVIFLYLVNFLHAVYNNPLKLTPKILPIKVVLLHNIKTGIIDHKGEYFCLLH
ncbi:hypothetical protein SAMN05518871_11319 [Psychrobacillus sp. OK028]|nr:hypothetical protein SAMN05518871_11319 [Psychrobacillus sp. OK028]